MILEIRAGGGGVLALVWFPAWEPDTIDHRMDAQQVTILVIVASLALIIGLRPGLVEGLQEGMRRVIDTIAGFHHPPSRPHRIEGARRAPGQIWFAVSGFICMLAALVAAISD